MSANTDSQLDEFTPTTWTGAARKKWLRTLPPEKMLPENQPSYVSSWIYVFGMLTIVAMIVAIASGVILTLGGVQWFHESSLGKFSNSLHYSHSSPSSRCTSYSCASTAWCRPSTPLTTKP